MADPGSNPETVPAAEKHEKDRLADARDLVDESSSNSELLLAIEACETMLKSIPRNHSDYPQYSLQLAALLQNRFYSIGSLTDLNHAIILSQETLQMTTLADQMRAELLNNLGVALRRRFGNQGSITDLNAAIEASEEALLLNPGDNPEGGMYFNNLGNAYQDRYKLSGSLSDLDLAILQQQKAIDRTPKNHTNHATYLHNLANSYIARFKYTGDTEDLTSSITYGMQTLNTSSTENPNHARYLVTLGNAMLNLFQRFGIPEHLNNAIMLLEDAVEQTPPQHSRRANCINSLASALSARFSQSRLEDDINRVSVLLEEAISLTQSNELLRTTYVSNLGVVYLMRFDQFGLTNDLDRAVVYFEQALSMTPNDHSSRAVYLNHLSNSLKRRFDRTSCIDDLDRAIAVGQSLVILNAHPDIIMFLNSLALALQSRFERNGAADDLDFAISTYDKILDQTPLNHPRRPGYLANCGMLLQRRFELTGSTEDLDRALRTSRDAVEAVSSDPSLLPTCLNSYGLALWRESERTSSSRAIDEAVEAFETSITLTPNDHPNLPLYLDNLGSALSDRFKSRQSSNDLNRAIDLKERAVALTPSTHHARAFRLNNLSTALQGMFEATNRPEDIDRAIEISQSAVKLISKGDVSISMFLFNLGRAFRLRCSHTKSVEDFSNAMDSYERAAAVEYASPTIRIKACHEGSHLLIHSIVRDKSGDGTNTLDISGRYVRAKHLLRIAVNLLPSVSDRVLNRRDQQYNISLFSGVASNAASVYLECGESPYEALSVLELGRGLIAGLQINVRSDISMLKVVYPDLWERIETVRRRLDRQQTWRTNEDINLSIQREDQRKLSKTFESLLCTVREKPGFEKFLLLPSEDELKLIANDGPIVVFNVSGIRSDAFIITSDTIQYISLPRLMQQDIPAYASGFLRSVNNASLQNHRVAQQELKVVLEWLWDVAMNPVLVKLGLTRSPSCGEKWPRVWWNGCGLLNLFPLHAAGYHDSVPPRSVINYVISSYTSTLRSLSYARERYRRVENSEPQSVLLIAMPETPEANNLPYATSEVECIQSLLPEKIPTTVITSPTKADVVKLLSTYQIVHFACHGYTCPTDPSESKLLLKDWKSSPLTVSDLSAINAEFPQFAFLSACHSGSMSELNLLDESITLSSSIQLAGFSSVIGTLWEVKDEDSAYVAARLYREMLDDGKLEPRRSAESMHHAIRALREKTRKNPGFTRLSPSDPLLWASYIHIGV